MFTKLCSKLFTHTLAVLAIALGIIALALLGLAHAAPPPDALDNPAESVGRVEALWRGGQVLHAIILAAFFALVVLRNRVAWFATGWRAAYCSAAIGGLALAVDLFATGATPNLGMAITVVLTTVGLLAKMPTAAGAGA